MKNVNYLSLLKQYEFVIGGGLVFFMVMLLTIFLLVPNYLKAREIYDKQGSVIKKIEALKKKDTALSSVNIEKYRNNYSKITNVLPLSKDFVYLFLRFDDLQRKTGISINRADFQLGVISTNSATLTKFSGTNSFIIPIRFDVSGTLSQFENFLDYLSNLSGRYISVDDIDWNIKNTDILKANINAKTFYYPEKSTSTKVETPISLITKESEALLDKIINNQTDISFIEEDNGQTQVGKKDLFN